MNLNRRGHEIARVRRYSLLLQSGELRAADIEPVRLDMEGPSGQQPAPAAALGDALAEALAVLQADGHCQEVSEQEGAQGRGLATEALSEAAGDEQRADARPALLVEVAAEFVVEDAQEHITDSCTGSVITTEAAIDAEADITTPADASSVASPADASLVTSPAAAAPGDNSTFQQKTPVTRRSMSKSPSPRRRPSPLQTALPANDENTAPASPAASPYSLPRSPSPAARSPGSKPAAAKSASALHAPLSPHGNAPVLVEAPAATTAASPTVTGVAGEQITSADAPVEALGVAAAQNSMETTEQVSPKAEHADMDGEQLTDGSPAPGAAPQTQEVLTPRTGSEANAAEPVVPATQMETPVRGLRILQGEPRNYADDELLTPASVAPFPGFGDHTAGGGCTEEATPSTAPRVADPAPFLSNNNVVFSPDTPAEALSGEHWLHITTLFMHARLCIKQSELSVLYEMFSYQ